VADPRGRRAPVPWSAMRAHLGKIVWGALAVAFGTGA